MAGDGPPHERRRPGPAGCAGRRRRHVGRGHRGGAAAGDQSAAERFALRAREVAESDPVGEHVGRALAHAVAARALLRHGRWDEARHALEAAEAVANLTHALPWLTVQVQLELAAAYVTLRDRTAAAAKVAA